MENDQIVSVDVCTQRIAVISEGIPHPYFGASLVLFFYYIKALIEAGYDVLSIVLVSDIDPDCGAIDRYRDSIGHSNKFSVVPVVTGGRLLQPSRLRIVKNFSVRDRIISLIGNYEAEIVVVFDIQVAALIQGLKASQLIVWLGDLAFEANWYHFLYSIREDWKTIRWLPYAIVQRLQWKRLYSNVLRSFDNCIVSSKSSEHQLSRIGIHSSFAAYPWPNQEVVDNDVKRRLPLLPTFLFYGHLVGLGSRSSLHFLFSELYPLLLKEWGKGEFRIIIGGRENLPTWVEREVSCRPELDYVGYIDDLTVMMAKIHAVIAPLDVPVGNRSRILTAQAKRALIIAHKNAALGNPFLIHEYNCMLAKNAQDFVKCMRVAVDSPKACLKMIDSAESTYQNHYAPDSAVCHLTRLLRC